LDDAFTAPAGVGATLSMPGIIYLAISYSFAFLAHLSESPATIALPRNAAGCRADRLGQNPAGFRLSRDRPTPHTSYVAVRTLGKIQMTHSIIGAGAIGSALAAHFVRFQVPVQIASHSDVGALRSAATKMGPEVRAVTVHEALQADMVFLAVPFDAVAAVVSTAPPWNSRVVVDCTNAIDFPSFTPRALGGRPSSELVAEWVQGARVVKAFNTLPAAILAQPASSAGGHRVVFLSGNEDSAKQDVAQLATSFGFAPIDLGTMSVGGRLQQFGGALVGHNFIKLS
jgi:8-hydroxy-5-deazaflavin:NADPH oxidoreductase